ncbi:MAG: hypothetical protein F6K04_08455 [Leptolyngbya sp. SIO4C5]|nr:hypothetical protein [Leptolyngbya sp. SIO4C5]
MILAVITASNPPNLPAQKNPAVAINPQSKGAIAFSENSQGDRLQLLKLLLSRY